nr:NADH dehydrogenase [ubiquinone] 1 alpha subcomplex assembly factor 8 isoform X1 [Vulpes vulpes]
MSGNGAVWGRVRGRLRAFPGRLAACGAEAAAYGRGVQASTAPGGRLAKDLCAPEFEALRRCFAAASSPGDSSLWGCGLEEAPWKDQTRSLHTGLSVVPFVAKKTLRGGL